MKCFKMFHFDKLCYDNKRHSYYANARQLYDKLPYPNVTNAMIEYYIQIPLLIPKLAIIKEI